MTQSTYLKYSDDYIGKHAQKTYFVRTIRQSYGPIEGFYITGIENVRLFIKNGKYCDWEVRDPAGNIIYNKSVHGGMFLCGTT